MKGARAPFEVSYSSVSRGNLSSYDNIRDADRTGPDPVRSGKKFVTSFVRPRPAGRSASSAIDSSLTRSCFVKKSVARHLHFVAFMGGYSQIIQDVRFRGGSKISERFFLKSARFLRAKRAEENFWPIGQNGPHPWAMHGCGAMAGRHDAQKWTPQVQAASARGALRIFFENGAM